MGELDENANPTKNSKSWNFEGKGYKAKDSFKTPIWQKRLCSMSSKCLISGVGHMCKK